jgi:hypothetical protein
MAVLEKHFMVEREIVKKERAECDHIRPLPLA